jgi:hypothetical protein
MPAWLSRRTRQRTKRLEKGVSGGGMRIDDRSGDSPLTIETGSDFGSPAILMIHDGQLTQKSPIDGILGRFGSEWHDRHRNCGRAAHWHGFLGAIRHRGSNRVGRPSGRRVDIPPGFRVASVTSDKESSAHRLRIRSGRAGRPAPRKRPIRRSRTTVAPSPARRATPLPSRPGPFSGLPT